MNRSTAVRAAAVVVLVLTLMGTVPALSACGGEESAGGPVKLTEADNGKAVTVSEGDEIQVVLAGNPTTGYSWSSALSDADKAILQQQGEPVYVQESTDPSLVGGGGTFTFTFKAIAPGKATIKLEYARPFDTGVAPIQTFSATAEVK